MVSDFYFRSKQALWWRNQGILLLGVGNRHDNSLMIVESGKKI